MNHGFDCCCPSCLFRTRNTALKSVVLLASVLAQVKRGPGRLTGELVDAIEELLDGPELSPWLQELAHSVLVAAGVDAEERH